MTQAKDGFSQSAQLIALGLAAGAVLGYTRKNDSAALGRIAELGLLGAAAWVALGFRIRPLATARRSVGVRTSMHIKRPVAEVFDFFQDFTNFPALIGGLSSVEDYEHGRSRWRAQTFAGRTLEWDTVVTKFVPNQVIAWESAPGSAVETSGVVRLEPVGDGETRVDIDLRYRPARTDVVEALYALHEAPRDELMDVDLRRVGEYIESRGARSESGVAGKDSPSGSSR